MINERRVDQKLLREASRRQSVVSWSFTAIGLILFFGYVALMAYNVPVLRVIFPGTRSTPVAIALGYVMILSTVVFTGLFVLVNNRYVRPLLDELRRGVEADRSPDNSYHV